MKKKILNYLVLQCLLFVLCVATAQFGSIFSFGNAYVSSVWPPTGIALAAIYLYGVRQFPAMFLSSTATFYLFQLPLETAALIGLAHTTVLIASANTLRKYFNEQLLDNPESTAAFGFVAILTSVANALVGTGILFTAEFLDITELLYSVYIWVAGDFLGIILLAPWIISWFKRPTGIPSSRRPITEKVIAFIGVALVTYFTLGTYHNYRFFLFIFLTWIGVRFTRKMTTLTTVVVSLIALWLFSSGRSTHIGSSDLDLLYIQTFLAVAQFNTLILSSIMFKQKKTEKQLRRSQEYLDDEVKRRTRKLRLSEQRFALALKNSNFLIYNQDGDLKYTWMHNPVKGYAQEDVIGKTDLDIYSKKAAKALTQVKQRVLQTVQSERVELNVGTDRKPLFYDLTIEPLINDKGEADGITVVAVEITERKKQEEKKDEFISIASHELKTPLTSIKGYVQILERKVRDLEDEQLHKYLDKTNEYIDKLQRLIGDLLDVSKIQAGKLIMNVEQVDVDQFVRDTVDSLQHTTSHVRLILKGRARAKIKGDKYRLEQVMTNLLTNAMKYAPESKKVIIKVQRQSSDVVISVTDFGIGIPKSEVNRIFQRFYRIQKQTKNVSGLGIGLYLSYEIIQRHLGTMWVESEVGKGSTFSFSLPIASARKSKKFTQL